MKLKLPAEIASTGDLRAACAELQAYSQWFARQAIKAKVGSSVGTAPELSPALSALLRQTGDTANQKLLDETLEALVKLSRDAPQLSITLAAPAAGEFKRQLTGWCRDNLAADALVNFSFNRLILGGMVVRSGSRLYDWSLRRAILDKRQNFAEVLRRV